jgi:hypothetical protein
VPPYGSFDNLQGQVLHVNPADYKVVVYIYVPACGNNGWWGPKPYWEFPLTNINNDGSWTTDITTGGCDEDATQIAAFLVPNGYTPPNVGNAPTLPAELFAFPWVQEARAAWWHHTIEALGCVWPLMAA